MFIFLLGIHLFISLALVVLILSQNNKGGALDGMVGSAATDMLGAHAGGFFKKWTVILGVLFLFSCVFLAFNISHSESFETSGFQKAAQQLDAQAPPVDIEAPVDAAIPAPAADTEAAPEATTPAPADTTK